MQKTLSANLGEKCFAEDLSALRFWQAMTKLSEDGYEVNVHTLSHEMSKRDPSNQWAIELAEILEHGAQTLNVDYFLDQVLERTWQKEVCGEMKTLSDAVQTNPDLNLKAMASRLENSPTSRGSGLNQKELSELLLQDIDERVRSKQLGIVQHSTGWENLDELINGWLPSSLNVLAGRPAMGKTSLGISFALSALKQKKSVVFFTIEMSAKEITRKFLSSISNVDNKKLLRGDLSDADADRIYHATKRFSELPIIVVDELTSIEKIVREATRHHKRGDCDMVVLDYVQLCKSEEKFNSPREKIIHVTNSLKVLAKDLGVPVLALAQIGRIRAGDTVRKPALTDLKESGSIEEDADTVLMIHRESYYGVGSKNLLIVGKSRHGEMGEVEFHASMSVNRFTEVRDGV